MPALADFQRALADLAASPEKYVAARLNAQAFLGNYELSDRDARRLRYLVMEDGGLMNCSLYRANRVTPVYRLLPRTCYLLGDRLRAQLMLFWQRYIGYDLQFPSEIGGFVEFLKQQLSDGELSDPYLAEVADFECALALLRYEVLQDRLPEQPHAVRFQHDPSILLQHLGVPERPPDGLPRDDFVILLTPEVLERF